MKTINKLSKKILIYRRGWIYTIGLIRNQVSYFEPEIFEKLKKHQYGGIPLNILIGSDKLANGKCYDRVMGLTFAFDNCVLVHGDLTIYAKVIGEKEYDHAWVEVGDFVYDTTWGIKINKKLYYKWMGVKVIKKMNKVQMLEHEYYVEQKESKIEDNLNVIDIIMPLIIPILERELKEYERIKSEYHICLTKTFIQECKDLLEHPRVKELIKEREDYWNNFKVV